MTTTKAERLEVMQQFVSTSVVFRVFEDFEEAVELLKELNTRTAGETCPCRECVMLRKTAKLLCEPAPKQLETPSDSMWRTSTEHERAEALEA